MITVIGMGLHPDDLTVRAAKKIECAQKVFVKTAKTPVFDYFIKNKSDVKTFDSLYDEAEDFDTLDERIIDALLSENEKATSFFAYAEAVSTTEPCRDLQKGRAISK